LARSLGGGVELSSVDGLTGRNIEEENFECVNVLPGRGEWKMGVGDSGIFE